MTSRTPLRPGDPLPEGWQWVRLGDITTLIKNKIDPRKFPEELFSLYSFPAYDAGQKPEVVRGSKIGSTKTIVQPGTVLFARLNPRIPRVWLVGEEHVGKTVASTEFLALFPTELVDSQWLRLWLLSPHVRDEVRSQVKGATKSRERISAEQVLSLDLPLPPLETQRRIVAWLDEAFSNLQAIKERHAEAEREAAALLPAKLAEVFGRAEKEGWRWVRLGEIVKQRRQQVDPSDLNGLLNYIGLEHIEPHTGRLASFEPTKADKLKSTKAVFKKGDLLYGKLRPYLNKVWLAEFDGISSTDIIALIPMANRAMGRFLGYILRSSPILSEVKDRMTGTRMPRIRPQQLLDIGIPLPSLETQRRIVEEIEAFEEEARRIQKAQEESRTILEQLEKSLLTEAFRPERWT